MATALTELISHCRARKIPLSSGVPKFRFFLKCWLPPLAWMAVIFLGSCDAESYRHSSSLFVPLLHWLFPQMSTERIEAVHHLFRKCGHLTEYAVLALLLWRAIRHARRAPLAPGQWRWDEAGLALAGVFLYAASDEFHQIFVPSRTALVSDVFIDTAGGAAGLLLLWSFGKIFKRR